MKTRVTMLLDRSASMAQIKEQVISGFNEYVKGLQLSAAADDIILDLIQFDSFSSEVVLRGVPVKSVRPLDHMTFQPRGNTPLIDAAMDTLKAVDAVRSWVTPSYTPISLKEPEAMGKQIVVFFTDGEENASLRHTMDQLRREVENRQGQGWEFVFLGCGFNAYGQAAKMGIQASHTVSLAASESAIRGVYGAMAQNVANYAGGATMDMAFSDQQKDAAEDQHKPA
jgi:hypothetical protein